MKICFSNLASGYSGGENQTFLLAKELFNRGIELVAVSNPNSLLTDKFSNLGVPVIEAANPLSGHFQSYLKGVSLVHAHDGRAVHWAALHHWLGTPYLITRRIDNPIKARFLTKLNYSRASALVGISSKICQVLEEFTGSSTVHLIPSSPVKYPFDEETIRGKRSLYKNKFIVIQAASLLEHKGFDISIKAAKILSNHGICFLFLGEGPFEKELRNLAEDVPNIVFLGKQKDMGNWFQIADCLILPSRNEGLGSVLLEAMEAGTPVIGTSVGGIPDIIKDQTTGLLIPPSSPEALANAILRLKTEPQLRNDLSYHASEFVRTLSIDKMAERYIQLYQEILKRK